MRFDAVSATRTFKARKSRRRLNRLGASGLGLFIILRFIRKSPSCLAPPPTGCIPSPVPLFMGKRRRLRFFPRLVHEVLEGRSLLTASPFYLPPQHFLFDQSGYLTQPNSGDPLDIVARLSEQQRGRPWSGAADFADVHLTDRYVSEETGVTHMYLRQSVAGLDVEHADLGIHITPLGEIIGIGGGFVPGLASQVDTGLISLTPTLNAEGAVRAAAASLGFGPVADLSVTAADDGAAFVVQAPDVSLDAIAANLHFVPTADGSATLAWRLIVRTPDSQHWYDLSVDAFGGDIVSLSDWSHSASYNVVPLPREGPNDEAGAFQVVTDPHLAATNASPFGWHDTNGVAGAESTLTIGNNIDVHMDRDGNNVADTASVTNSKARPDGGAALELQRGHAQSGLWPPPPRKIKTRRWSTYFTG